MRNIYILHGWGYTTKDSNPQIKWQPFISLLKANGYHPLLLKIPVLSYSFECVFTLDDYVTWLLQEINKISGKVVLIGHSNGGRISLAFAQKYPHKVDKLILIDSAGIYHNELPIRLKRFVFSKIAKFGKKLTNSSVLKTVLYKVAREQDYLEATPSQKQTMINLITQDLTNILSQISKPTLIIWGKEDKVTPLADGQKMHALIPNSKLEIIAQARHSPQFTQSEKVANIVINFLEK